MSDFTGAKRAAGVWQWLINHMPPHVCFIEGFLGTGAITKAKAPAVCSIGIDADAEAPGLSFFRPDFIGICGDSISLLPVLVESLRDLHGESAEGGHRPSGLGVNTDVRSQILVYLDPPYLGSVRRTPNRRYYKNELLTDEEHLGLLNVAKSLPCRVMISGYWSELYWMELAGWRCDTFKTITRAGRATEYLWMNFDRPEQLHDVRHYGRNFRERDNLKRKKERWKNRLAAMDSQERQVLREAIAEVLA